MKNSKITKVTPSGSFDSSYGTMFKFEVHFENGEYGDANCKEQNQKVWVVGENVWYTLTPNTNTKYNGKLKKEKAPEGQPISNTQSVQSNYKPKEEGIITMLSCISSACNAVAQSSKAADKLFILDMAESFYKASMSKSSTEKPVQESKPVQSKETIDDLPF